MRWWNRMGARELADSMGRLRKLPAGFRRPRAVRPRRGGPLPWLILSVGACLAAALLATRWKNLVSAVSGRTGRLKERMRVGVRDRNAGDQGRNGMGPLGGIRRNLEQRRERREIFAFNSRN